VSKALATWFGCGHLPIAPGTWGSLAALPLGVLLLWLGGWSLLAAASVAISLAGWWASAQHVRSLGQDDPDEIVVDEVAGQWLALLPASLTWTDALCALLLFRAADILKPWPANWADRAIPGGLGVMVDDWIAGLYAALALAALRNGGLL